ncbi:MAG: AroM family protein [Stellaceae bacterium]
MRRNVLGMVTIGAAPRPDLVPILARHVPAGVRQIHKGVLDGLAPAEIAARFGPEPGKPVLVTRLQRDAASLAAAGADVVLLDCIGFAEPHKEVAAASRLPVLLSNALVAKTVGELF